MGFSFNLIPAVFRLKPASDGDNAKPVKTRRPRRKRTMRRALIEESAKLAGLYLLMSPLVAKPFYDFMLFHPDRAEYKQSTEGVARQLKAELQVAVSEFKIPVQDGNKLNARYFKRPGATKIAIVSHGNGGNIDHRSVLVAALLCCNINVLVYDYEGYGQSSGKVSVKAMVRDGLAVYDYTANVLKFQPKEIVLYGESIGCGVTAQIADQRKVGAIIMQSGFSDLFKAGSEYLFYLPMYPVSWFDDLDNVAVMKKPHAPLLILCGDMDRTIAPHHSQDLFAAAVEPKQLVQFKNFGHCLESVDRLDYLGTVGSFLKKLN